MINEIRGRVLRLGDDVDTDQIYPARYIEITEERKMAEHTLEGVDLGLPAQLSEYSIVVAGRNLGCGSSREHAARGLRAAGIKALVAESFARIFFRNAINLGLPAIHLSSTEEIKTGDNLRIYLAKGSLINETTGLQFAFGEFSGLVLEVLAEGGLARYYRHRNDNSRGQE